MSLWVFAPHADASPETFFTQHGARTSQSLSLQMPQIKKKRRRRNEATNEGLLEKKKGVRLYPNFVFDKGDGAHLGILGVVGNDEKGSAGQGVSFFTKIGCISGGLSEYKRQRDPLRFVPV